MTEVVRPLTPPLSPQAGTGSMSAILKKATISALVALVLFALMIGIRTDAGPSAQLIYWTRFGQLAAVVAAQPEDGLQQGIACVRHRLRCSPSSGRGRIKKRFLTS